MQLTTFSKVDLADPFFDSLKTGYKEFPVWFAKKAEELVYITTNSAGMMQGFLYLKREEGEITDVTPPLPHAKWLKVGTLKIVAHGTKLGERYVKKIFDTAIKENVSGIYVTVFEEHANLIRLFKRYGFNQHSTKKTPNGVELVFVRNLNEFTGDQRSDYPFVRSKAAKKYLLAIYPDYHTRLLPDSILNNESKDVVEDLSHTNTIHKVYICSMNVGGLKPGDILLMYRTSDKKGPAKYRSVVTSMCVVEEIRSRKHFANLGAFIKYALPHSVFSREELKDWWAKKKRLHVIRMTYNAAFETRTTRGVLLDDVGLSDTRRYDFFELTTPQFRKIIKLGKVDESIVVD